jgi:hypothetical protein
MAQAVLRSCEAAVKPQLQKFLTTLILSPISSNSDLHQHCYTLIYQVSRRTPWAAALACIICCAAVTLVRCFIVLATSASALFALHVH